MFTCTLNCGKSDDFIYFSHRIMLDSSLLDIVRHAGR